jgi:hypothetical protein
MASELQFLAKCSEKWKNPPCEVKPRLFVKYSVFFCKEKWVRSSDDGISEFIFNERSEALQTQAK